MTFDMRNILQIEDSDHILRQKSRKLTKKEIYSHKITSLILEMKDIMRNTPGVGLAAAQIGVSMQLAVIEDPEERLQNMPPQVLKDRGRMPVNFHVIINPRIIQLSGRTNYFFEGCLSIKNRVRVTPRKEIIQMICLDENAEEKVITARGWYARILQHEIDHLHGKLYIDVSDSRSEMELNEEYKKKWLNATSAEIYQFYMDKCPGAACE